MKYFAILFAAVSLAAVLSFQKSKKMNNETGLPASNPFSKSSTLPFQAPPFDKIKNEDYKPALEEGIIEQQKEIDAIANNAASPTLKIHLCLWKKAGNY
ncbi:MAG: hypothetical protein ABJB05_14515 [Parafilimonas sp.]